METASSDQLCYRAKKAADTIFSCLSSLGICRTHVRLWYSKVLTMSVPKSMQRIVTVPKGRGMLAMMKIRKGVISGMLLVKV